MFILLSRAMLDRHVQTKGNPFQRLKKDIAEDMIVDNAKEAMR